MGLSADEIKNARYNSVVSTVELDDRMVFVKDKKIAAFLSECTDISDLGKFSSEADSSGIALKLVYKMGFFNIRYEQKKLGQPEDMVRIREMERLISDDSAALNAEYLEYEQCRNAM